MKIQKLSDVYQPLIKKEDQVQSLLGAKKDLSERRVIGFFGQDKVYDALEDHYNKLQKAIKDGRLTEEMLEDDSYLYENIDFVIINPSFPLTELFSDPWGFIGRIYNYPNNKPILVRYDMVTMDHKNIANYIPHENIFVFCIKYPTLKKIVEHGSIPHDIMVRWSSSFEHEAQHHFGHIYNMVKNEISKPYEEKEDEIRSRWAQVQQMLRNLGPSDSFISYIDHIFMNKEKWRKGINKQLFIDEINRLIYKYSMLVLGVLNEGHNSVDMAYKVLQGKFTKQAIGEFIKLLEENNFDSIDMDLHKVLNASDLHEKRMRNIEKLAKKIDKLIDCPFENCNIKKAEEFIRYVIQGRDEPSHFIYGPFMTEEEAKVWGWWTWAGDSAEEQFRTITYGEEWEYLLRQQDPKTREVDEESSKLFPIDKLPLWQSYFIKQYAKDGRLSFGQLKSAINEVLSGDHGNGKNRSGDPGLNLALDVLYVLRERGLAKQFGED